MTLEYAIREAVADFFGDSVRPDTRAIQALGVTDDPEGQSGASSLCILQAALESYPVFGNVLQQIGARLDIIKFTSVFPYDVGKNPEESTLSFEIARALETWFIDDSEGGFTDAAHEVIETGTLSALQIVRSCLQTTWLEGGLGDDPPAVNDVSGEFIRALNIDSSRTKIALQAVDKAIAHPYQLDRDFGDQQFVLFHDGQKVRIRPFGVFGGFQLAETPLKDGSLWVARGNVLQPSTRFSTEAISHLEDLVNSDAPESAFQDFFENHDEFLLALGDYQAIHSQLVLTEDCGKRLIPDFFLEKYDSFVDVLDLKRANVELVRAQRNRTRFRDAVQEAVAQLTHYRSWFEERVQRRSFTDRYGLNAFRPSVVVIIGRRHSFDSDIQRLQLESGLPDWVSLRTYDDVIEKARQWRGLTSDLQQFAAGDKADDS